MLQVNEKKLIYEVIMKLKLDVIKLLLKCILLMDKISVDKVKFADVIRYNTIRFRRQKQHWLR
jgi:hypothetical protein